MQPRTFLGTTLALMMGVTGLAAADDPQGAQAPQASQSSDTSSASSTVTLTSREQTQEMQRALRARNLYQGPIDGVWGPKTEGAVRNFQTQTGLEPTGTLNDATASALGMSLSKEKMSETAVVASPDPGAATAEDHPAMARGERQTVSGTDGPKSTRSQQSQAALEDSSTNVQLGSLSQQQASELQQRLQLLGYYRGTIDGKVGEQTRAALQRYFQRQADLAKQGVISNAAIGMFGTAPSDVQPVSGED